MAASSADMPSDPWEKFEKRFREDIERFLQQQRAAYSELAEAARANPQAALRAEEGPGGQSSHPLAGAPTSAEHEDTYKHVYEGIAGGDESTAFLGTTAREIAGHFDTMDEECNCVQSRIFQKMVYGINLENTMETLINKSFTILALALVISMCTQLTLEVHCEMKHKLLPLVEDKTKNISSEVWDYFDGKGAQFRSGWDPKFCPGMDVWARVNIAFFTLEILVRLMAGLKLFFCHRKNWWWNILDLVLLFVNYMDVFDAEVMDPRMKAVNVLRMLRVFRLFEFFPTVQNMVYSIVACKNALASALLLLGVFTMMNTIFFMQIASFYVDKHPEELSPTDFRNIVYNWNGFFDSFMSLVYAVTGGADWHDLAEPFLHMGGSGSMGSIWLVFFTGYVVFTTMGLLNVLVGIFVSQANNFTNVSIEAAIGKAKLEIRETIENANKLFDLIQAHSKKLGRDVDDRFLTTDQIRDAYQDDDVKALYTHLEIDIINPQQMLKTFDINRNDKVEKGEFVTGCMRLRGSAKPMEVQAILDQTIQINRKLNDLVPRAGSKSVV